MLAVFGYLGALLTGVYTFRMIFRAFLGDPCPEAEELSTATCTTPSTVQPRHRRDRGHRGRLPRPRHAVAEQNGTMKFAMSALAVLAVIGGLVQIPGVDDKITQFLAPTFAADPLYTHDPSSGTAWIGLIIGALIAVAGISIAFRLYVRAPGTSARLQERAGALHTFLYNKWYFDELIDLLVVRPAQSPAASSARPSRAA